MIVLLIFFFFQAEDGIRDLVRSRGLGDVYKRQVLVQDMNGRIKPINTLSSELLRKISRKESYQGQNSDQVLLGMASFPEIWTKVPFLKICLLYTSDAADERSSVDLGGRRIIKKKKNKRIRKKKNKKKKKNIKKNKKTTTTLNSKPLNIE